MQIFNLKGSDLSPLSEKKFNLEKDIQSLTEKNLETIFGYEFVSTEFNVNNFWIDTLAFDPESRSFIIIEYKRDQGMSVVDQGYAYLAAMLNNKAEFILEYNEKLKESLNRNDVDWSQSKVIFVSRHFTTHQKGAIEFKDLPIELWEVKKFEEDILVFNQLKPAEIKDSIKTVSKSKTVRDVSAEVKSYTLDDHLAKIDEKSKEIFLNLYNQIMDIGDGIKENVTKYYVGFRFHGTNFTSLTPKNEKVIFHFRTKTKPDTRLKVEKLPSTKWDTTPLWKTEINDVSEIPLALEIAKHAYKDYESRFK